MTYTISGVLFTHSVDPCELVRVAFPELTPTGADEMSPQPMSDADRNSRVIDLYDELAEGGKHGHFEALFHIVRLEVERAIAARDAQWAAMIGEPVAWNLAGGRTFMDKPFTNRTGAELMASQRNDGSTVSPLYAIKETP